MNENETNETAAFTQQITHAEFEAMAKQVAEIHGFLSGIAAALKSPMLAAMLPPQFRNMLP